FVIALLSWSFHKVEKRHIGAFFALVERATCVEKEIKVKGFSFSIQDTLRGTEQKEILGSSRFKEIEAVYAALFLIAFITSGLFSEIIQKVF
ncbi:MAG: hypothetical protein L3J61_02470, partial [Ghiorsea sp.]|nr:hypothetical protein [Ghiorsea sp.]